jgi:hypothetical protein
LKPIVAEPISVRLFCSADASQVTGRWASSTGQSVFLEKKYGKLALYERTRTYQAEILSFRIKNVLRTA